MASSKFIFSSIVLLVVLLCLLLVKDTSDCVSVHECVGVHATLMEIRNRKVLSSLKSTMAAGSSSIMYGGGKTLSWELRKVPSGPDPLHHNGGSPIKPETP